MKSLPLLVLAVLGAACGSEPTKAPALTAPKAPLRATTADPSLRAATICLSYNRDLALAQAALKDNPTSDRLQRRLVNVQKLLKDACP